MAVLTVGGAAVIMPSGYSLGFYLLCFAGLFLWLKHRGTLVSADTSYFFGPLLIYAVGQGVMALHDKWAAREFEPYWPFILTIFGVWAIRRYKPRVEWFWCGLALGSVGAAAISGYQALALGWRAQGYTNSIQFGNIAMLLGVLCMVRALLVLNLSLLNQLMWIGFISGFVASAWSQTRGGWLAVVLVFIWILVNATRKWSPIKRWATFLIFTLFLVISVHRPDGVVHEKVTESLSQVKAFLDNGEQKNSVGVRLALWSAGIQGVAQAPWFGSGNQGWANIRGNAISDGRLMEEAKVFEHLHNDYLNALVKRGFIGVLLLTILYFGPTLLFFRPYLKHSSLDVRALAMCGVVVPLMFINFGLTQTFLSHNSGRVVLCSLWMCVAGLMLNAVETSKSSYQAAPNC